MKSTGQMGPREAMDMQVKRAGFLTKIVVLALLITAAVALLQLRTRITQAQREEDALRSQVTEQTQINTDLRDKVDRSGDPDRQADIARGELGLAAPGEKVIVFTD